jgi:hypothetical protein
LQISKIKQPSSPNPQNATIVLLQQLCGETKKKNFKKWTIRHNSGRSISNSRNLILLNQLLYLLHRHPHQNPEREKERKKERSYGITNTKEMTLQTSNIKKPSSLHCDTGFSKEFEEPKNAILSV